MKIKINKIGFIAVWVLLLSLTGCVRESLTKPTDDGELDYSELVPVSLGRIFIASDEAVTRANTYLADGEKLRLYAFPDNVTDYSKLIVSYTYTIVGGILVMDPGQGSDALYLPSGKVDIYMVSPSAVQIGEEVIPDNPDTPEDESATNPIYNEIATKSGITVPAGVDFLASKTNAYLNRGIPNTIDFLGLTHQMAKVQVRVKALPDATYATLQLLSVNIDGQTETPQPFIFNDSGGYFAPVGAGTLKVALGDITEVDPGKEYTATALVFPRKAEKMKIEIEFLADLNVAEGAAPVQEIYLMSGVVSDLALIGGWSNTLKTEPRTSLDITWRPEVLPWDDKPAITLPIFDMVFNYDGNDAPEMIDGKLSWRDRSGSNNHAVLEGNVTYDPVNKCYNLPTDTDLLRLPKLGYVEEYTLELAITCEPVTPGSGDKTVYFNELPTGGVRDLSLHLPYTGHKTYFDSPMKTDTRQEYCFDTESVEPIANKIDRMYYHTFRTYHFSKSNTTMAMYMGVNGAIKKSVNSVSNKHGAFNFNLIGGVNKLRIRSARLYRKVLTAAELKANYDADQATYRQQSDIVRDASLLLELDGKVPPYSEGADTYWPDMSGNKNHAKYLNIGGGTNNIVHTGSGYRFDNAKNSRAFSIMKLKNALGNIQTYTLEIVAKASGANTIFYGSNSETADNRAINIHLPWDETIYFDSPFPGSGRMTYNGPLSKLSYLSVNTPSFAFTRQFTTAGASDNLMRIIINGTTINSFKPMVATHVLDHIYIGNSPTDVGGTYTFVGEIKAIRFYNRVLTDAEILKNRNADKVRYKL